MPWNIGIARKVSLKGGLYSVEFAPADEPGATVSVQIRETDDTRKLVREGAPIELCVPFRYTGRLVYREPLEAADTWELVIETDEGRRVLQVTGKWWAQPQIGETVTVEVADNSPRPGGAQN